MDFRTLVAKAVKLLELLKQYIFEYHLPCATPVFCHLLWRDVSVAYVFQDVYGVVLYLGFVGVWGTHFNSSLCV